MSLATNRQNYAAAAAYAIAVAVGAYVCFSTFPIVFLFPTAPWDGFLSQDTSQHIIGQRYFISDSWRWPLLDTKILNTPVGANISFTDSIPFQAIILKVLEPLLPDAFQGIGLWYGVCWFLQPVAAVWCLRSAGERRVIPALCVAVVAASIPAWWNRFGHAALTSHFLLLLALGGYFHLIAKTTASRWALAVALNIVALLVHPYIFFMTTMIFCAVPVTLLLRDRARAVAAITGCSALLLISLAAVFIFDYAGAKGGGGYGDFSMNLLSPFWPAGSSLLPFQVPRIESAPGSEWEGYAYLGAGLLLLLAIAIVFRGGYLIESAKYNIGLSLVFSVFVFLSISNVVGIGYIVIRDIYPSNFIFDNFRSSARMFWPATYMLLIVTVIAVSNLKNAWLRSGILICAAALQFADTGLVRHGLAGYLQNPLQPWTVNAADLRKIFSGSGKLTIIPKLNCMPAENLDRQTTQALSIILIASETALPVNTMYMARWHEQPPCNDHDIASSPLSPAEARLFLSSVRETYADAISAMGEKCRLYGDVTACVADERVHGGN